MRIAQMHDGAFEIWDCLFDFDWDKYKNKIILIVFNVFIICIIYVIVLYMLSKVKMIARDSGIK